MVFGKQWFIQNQRILKIFTNTRYGKDILGISDSSIFRDEKIDFILPNALVKRTKDKEYVFEFISSNKYSKRLIHSFNPIWKAFHWFDMNMANIYMPRFNLGFDTFNPASGDVSSYDGIVGVSTDTTSWSTLRNDTGNISTAVETSLDNRLRTQSTTTNYREMRRAILLFNTAALVNDFKIGKAILSLYGYYKNNNNGDVNTYICGCTPTSTSSIASSDYALAKWGSTSFGYITYADFSIGAYNDIKLNTSGMAAISLTGITKLGFRNHWDFENTTSGQSLSVNAYSRHRCYSADNGSNEPKLIIEAFVPSGGNPMFFGGGVTIG